MLQLLSPCAPTREPTSSGARALQLERSPCALGEIMHAAARIPPAATKTGGSLIN